MGVPLHAVSVAAMFRVNAAACVNFLAEKLFPSGFLCADVVCACMWCHVVSTAGWMLELLGRVSYLGHCSEILF